LTENTHRCGFVAIVGRPNVGKSTLINRLVGKKISIVSAKPQTTRHQIRGILTRQNEQIIFVDTPGLHPAKGKAINKIINRTARNSISDVDLLLFVVDARGWRNEDELILDAVRRSGVPAVLLINKTDRLKDRPQLLPFMQEAAKKHDFIHIIPVSAKTGEGLEQMIDSIVSLLPVSPPGYPESQVTDRGERFQAAEFVREQIFRTLGQELPYATAVEISDYQKEDKIDRITAIIWVEHESQKAILIGKKGQKIRDIGTSARQQMERIFGRKIFLDLRVKVRSGWSNDQGFLRQLGYSEEI
jgi:GTP-binding protein Era